MLLDMADEDEVWDGDEFGEPLPVLTGTEAPPVDLTLPRRRRRGQPWSPRGGTKVSNLSEARKAALNDATGRGRAEPDQWREEMGMGDRGRAASSLESGGRNRGSSGGFGL